MSHPFAKHKEHHAAKRRVGHILKGHKRGGTAKHSDEAEDRALFKKMMAEHEAKEAKVEGHKSGGRLDKYARGGKTKGKKPHTQVNIAVVAPHGRPPSAESAAPAPGGPPPPPAGGPMLPPGGMPPPGLMGKPPGMMNRGGRLKKVKLTGGDNGVGRKEKAKSYGLKPHRG